MIGIDAVMLPIAFWLSLSLKFDSFIPPVEHIATFVCVVVFGVVTFSTLGLYRAVIRFMGVKALGRIVVGVTLSVVALSFFGETFGAERIGTSALSIYWRNAM